MKRLFGSKKSKEQMVVDNATKNQDEVKVSRVDMLLFGLRSIFLFSALVCSILVAVTCTKLMSQHDNECAFTLKFTHDKVGYETKTPCYYIKYVAIAGSVMACILKLITILNIRNRAFIPKPSYMAFVQVLLVLLMLVAWIGMSAVITISLQQVCKNASTPELEAQHLSCASLLDSISNQLCVNCKEGLLHGLHSSMEYTRNSALAATVAWLLVALMVLIRYIRARRAAKRLEEAQAKVEEELRREFAEKKLQQEMEAQRKPKEGEGFVFRMLQ